MTSQCSVVNSLVLCVQNAGNPFDSKFDKGSADLYFHYYGMLQHQQNMLQVSTASSDWPLLYVVLLLRAMCDLA